MAPPPRSPPSPAWILRACEATSRACAMRRASVPKNRSISFRTVSYIPPPSSACHRRPAPPGSPPPPQGNDEQDGKHQGQVEVGHEVESLQVGRCPAGNRRCQEFADKRRGIDLLLPVGSLFQRIGQVEPRKVPADGPPLCPPPSPRWPCAPGPDGELRLPPLLPVVPG